MSLYILYKISETALLARSLYKLPIRGLLHSSCLEKMSRRSCARSSAEIFTKGICRFNLASLLPETTLDEHHDNTMVLSAFHFMILATHCLGPRAGYFFYAPPLPLAPPEGVHLYSPFLGPIAGDRGGDWKDMVSYVHWSFLLGSYLVRRCGTVVHHEHAKALMSLHSVPVWLFLRAALIFCAFNLCLSQVLFAQTYLENIGANKSSS